MMLEDRTLEPQMTEEFKIKIKELRMVLQWFWSPHTKPNPLI